MSENDPTVQHFFDDNPHAYRASCTAAVGSGVFMFVYSIDNVFTSTSFGAVDHRLEIAESAQGNTEGHAAPLKDQRELHSAQVAESHTSQAENFGAIGVMLGSGAVAFTLVAAGAYGISRLTRRYSRATT